MTARLIAFHRLQALDGGINSRPTARINGLTSGTITAPACGSTLTLSSAGSTDSDGTIASYSWLLSGNGYGGLAAAGVIATASTLSLAYSGATTGGVNPTFTAMPKLPKLASSANYQVRWCRGCVCAGTCPPCF